MVIIFPFSFPYCSPLSGCKVNCHQHFVGMTRITPLVGSVRAGLCCTWRIELASGFVMINQSSSPRLNESVVKSWKEKNQWNTLFDSRNMLMLLQDEMDEADPFLRTVFRVTFGCSPTSRSVRLTQCLVGLKPFWVWQFNGIRWNHPVRRNELLKHSLSAFESRTDKRFASVPC